MDLDVSRVRLVARLSRTARGFRSRLWSTACDCGPPATIRPGSGWSSRCRQSVPRLHRAALRRDGRLARWLPRPAAAPSRRCRVGDSGPRSTDLRRAEGPRAPRRACPRFLVNELAADIAGKGRDELVFTGAKGGALRAQVFHAFGAYQRRRTDRDCGAAPARTAAHGGEPCDRLRCDGQGRAAELGHKSATMTLDLYGHLYADQLDDVGDRLHEAAIAAFDSARGLPADVLRTKPTSILNARSS